MKPHIAILASASANLVLLAACSTSAVAPPPSANTLQKSAVLQKSERGKHDEFHMDGADFEKKFGSDRSTIERAPKPVVAPIPPLPTKMFQGGRGGWIDFIVRIDESARVSRVDVVGYSEPDIVIPASAESIRKWRFSNGTKPGYYQLRLSFFIVGPSHADVSFE